MILKPARSEIMYRVRAMSVVQFIDETPAGELLRQHEVRLPEQEAVKARELLSLRFGDNADLACEAFARGAFHLQIGEARIESLDAPVALVPGLEVKLIRLVQLES